MHVDAISRGIHTRYLSPGDDFDSFDDESLGQYGRDLIILFSEDAVATYEHRHQRSEASIDLGELKGDCAAPDDEQMVRQVSQLQQIVADQILRSLETAKSRNDGLGASGDNRLRHANRSPVDGNPRRGLEAGFPPDEIDILVSLNTSRHSLDADLHDFGPTILDGGKVHPDLSRLEPEFPRTTGQMYRLGGPDQGLCGDTTHVLSGAADISLIQ